jgi:hypothetical protein
MKFEEIWRSMEERNMKESIRRRLLLRRLVCYLYADTFVILLLMLLTMHDTPFYSVRI